MTLSKLFTALCAVLLVAGCTSPRDSAEPTSSGTTTPTAGGTAVPLDGLYVIEWPGPVSHIGVRIDTVVKRPGERNVFAFRTACRERDECVVTGGGVPDTSDLTAPLAAVRIGDYVDGRWSIVWLTEKGMTCTGGDGKSHSSPVWTYFDIENDLTMTATLVGTGDCPFIEVHSPTVTKSSDSLHGMPVPDPAEQSARVVPVGAGFTGDYTVTRTPRGGGAETLTNRRVTTHCLRAESQCVSTSVNDEAAEFSVLEFDGDAFSRRAAAVTQPCGTGGDGVAAVTETLRSTGGSAPLRTLSGERTTTFSTGCAGSVTDDVTYSLADD